MFLQIPQKRSIPSLIQTTKVLKTRICLFISINQLNYPDFISSKNIFADGLQTYLSGKRLKAEFSYYKSSVRKESRCDTAFFQKISVVYFDSHLSETFSACSFFGMVQKVASLSIQTNSMLEKSNTLFSFIQTV